MIRFGFACKVIGIPGTAQTGLTLARASEENLLEVSRKNLFALGNMIKYCKTEGVALMRLSSDTIPLASHPDISFDWKEQLRDELQTLKRQITQTKIRASMHPGQYTVLNSPREDVVEHSAADLVYHADFLQALGCDHSARIVMHLGGAYGDKKEALDRFEQNFLALPKFVKDRLALENDERIYTIENVLDMCARLSLPAIFDVFHHALNPPEHGDMGYWLNRAMSTWSSDTGPPKIHYSQQLPGGKPGSHSLTVSLEEFLTFYESLGSRDLDVMLEVKDKNLSALKCKNLTDKGLPRKKLTDEWARYKYLVLEQSPNHYGRVRELLKSEQPEAKDFYRHIESALKEETTPNRAKNAAQHVWGYFDQLAGPKESRQILADLENFEADPRAVSRVKRKLFSLAEKNQVTYLLNSLYFYFKKAGHLTLTLIPP